MFRIEPNLQVLPLRSLRPTQMTVGMRKVAEKRRALKGVAAKKRPAHMAAQLYPAVKGPSKVFYIIDHHHEALAALQEGAEDVTVGLVVDLSRLSMEAFWVYMDHRSWVHCYDRDGRRRPFSAVPRRFEDLNDDPYRSLAASVEEAGGFPSWTSRSWSSCGRTTSALTSPTRLSTSTTAAPSRKRSASPARRRAAFCRGGQATAERPGRLLIVARKPS